MDHRSFLQGWQSSLGFDRISQLLDFGFGFGKLAGPLASGRLGFERNFACPSHPLGVT